MEDYYQQMLDNKFNKNGYVNLPLKGEWFEMFALDAKEFENAGWKFHLSVHRGDVARAWNIAVEEMVNDDKVSLQHQAKVAMPAVADKHSKPDHPQAGKTIVIYTDVNIPPEHYQRLLERIERKLKAAGVRPGPDVKGDNRVPGSAFIFYRNDQDLAGEYNAAARNAGITQARQYNPYRKDDPYKDFSISDAPVISFKQARARPASPTLPRPG